MLLTKFVQIAPLEGTVPKLTFNYNARFVLTIMHFLHHTENVCKYIAIKVFRAKMHKCLDGRGALS